MIARGFSALTMKQRGYICAELKVGGYDVIAAVLKARRRCPGLSHIAVIGSFNMIYGIESIRDASRHEALYLPGQFRTPAR